MKRIYMRAVMQEMIFLLGVAGISSAFDSDIHAELPALRYEDFAALRPQYSAVSWRGMAAKLLKDRLAVKTLREGKTALQLSRTGLETFLSLFLIGTPPESSQSWQLCLLKSLTGKNASWVEARRALRRHGFSSIQPQVFLRFQSSYDGSLALELKKLGFLVSFIPVRPELAQPTGLNEFVEGTETGFLPLQRKVGEVSKEVMLLLSEVQKKKVVHSKDKQRVGNIIVSGLHLIADLEPGWYLKRDRYELVKALAEGLQELSLTLFLRL